jgi:hypothetical protein
MDRLLKIRLLLNSDSYIIIFFLLAILSSYDNLVLIQVLANKVSKERLTNFVESLAKRFEYKKWFGD